MQISEELQDLRVSDHHRGRAQRFRRRRTLRSVIRFAVENALKFLDNERRRMGELSEQCSRYPLSAGKTRQAIQLIEGIAAILRSVQPRL